MTRGVQPVSPRIVSLLDAPPRPLTRATVISPSPTFFRVGAAFSLAAVVSIILAQFVFVPAAPSPDISGLLEAYSSDTLRAQSLTILLQVMAMFVALLVLSTKVFPEAPGLTLLAVGFLMLWQVFELVPRSIDYFTFSLRQAPAYIAGASVAAAVEQRFEDFLAWEGGLRSIRQVVWATGLLLVGGATWHAKGLLARCLAVGLLANGLRVAALFGGSMLGFSLPFGRWLFVLVNVAVFGLLAVWLWTEPRLENGPPSAVAARS